MFLCGSREGICANNETGFGKTEGIEEQDVKSNSRFCLAIVGLALAIAASGPCRAQADGSHQAGPTSNFAPLEAWKNSVLTGDTAGLRMLYSSNPPAEIKSPAAKNTADADVDFWI